MPIFRKTQEELMRESIDHISGSTALRRFGTGGKVQALLASMNKKIEDEYRIFDLRLLQSFLSGAHGRYLDFIGEMLGLSRLGPQGGNSSATARNVKFYVDTGNFGNINNLNSIQIP